MWGNFGKGWGSVLSDRHPLVNTVEFLVCDFSSATAFKAQGPRKFFEFW